MPLGRDSRALILVAAADEFTTHGFAGARVDRIARHAGVNKQLLFYYFGSKAGLHQAVVRGLIEEANVQGAHAPVSSALADARLREAVARLFRSLDARPHLVRLSTQAREGEGDLSLQHALELLAVPIRQAVLDGQGVGFFRDDADPDFVANLAACAVVGHLTAAPGSTGRAEPSAEWSDALADLLVRGLAW